MLKNVPFTIDNVSWEFIILSGLYLFVFRPIYKRRESKRIQDANNEIIKMNIFFIINDNLITEELFQKIYDGILIRYNLHSSKVYPIDRIMNEIHSYIQSEKYTDEQRKLFYERFIDKENQILECTPKQRSMLRTERIKERIRDVLFIAMLLLMESFAILFAIEHYGEKTVDTWFNRFFWFGSFSIVLSVIVLGIEILASNAFKKYIEKYWIKSQKWINSYDK